MPVALEPPLASGGAHLPWYTGQERTRDVPLEEGPRYVRTSGMSRWHRVRSGWVHGRDKRQIFNLWCGQSTWNTKPGFRFTDDDPHQLDGYPICGTCEGRAIGADDANLRLRYDPRRLTPPAKCPGSGESGLWVKAGDFAGRLGICLVCRETVPTRAGGGWVRGWYGLTSHPPGPGLVDGCPFHAWRELRKNDDGSVACRCGLTASDPFPTPPDNGGPGSKPWVPKGLEGIAFDPPPDDEIDLDITPKENP